MNAFTLKVEQENRTNTEQNGKMLQNLVIKKRTVGAGEGWMKEGKGEELGQLLIE